MLKPLMKVLLVDDVSKTRRFTKILLKRVGFIHIQETDNGKTALSMIEEGEFDMVVTNFYLPEMDGIDLLKTLKGNPTLAHVAVLIVGEPAKKEDFITAAKAGAGGYIVTPFNASTLDAKIEMMLKTIG